MGLTIPNYWLVGDKPVSLTRNAEGGAELLGWDFDLGEMTHGGASWDDIEGLTPGVDVEDQVEFAEGDVRVVTKAEFDRHVAELRARAAR